jgi:transcriptional regulator with PAS, ATPase and Fis domain
MAAMSLPDLTHTTDARQSALRVRSAKLVITKGPDAGRSATIDQPTFVIGTGQSADVRLGDPAVSREHVRVSLLPNGVRIRDDGSKNGTWLGGVRIREVLLSSDTSLVVGGTTLAITIEADDLALPLSANDRFGDAIGGSPVMRNLFAILEKVAPTELTVLLEGESGTGKDVLSRAIHARSSRANEPMVVLDCGAIPGTLIESELFGHERGAFTGADRARKGVFEEAHGGTLFLDEIGELPVEMQPKLLRALEAREVRPIGARASKSVDVRVIAATSRRLAEAARTGEFRSDLFYRLAVARVTVPPLRERPEDVLPIARAMLRVLRNDPDLEIPADLASMLVAYPWPGNVRELRNVVERWAALGRLDRTMFDPLEAQTSAEDDLALLTYHEARKIVLDRFEEKYLPRVLARAGGVMARAAELADVARPSFYRMLERIRPRGE